MRYGLSSDYQSIPDDCSAYNYDHPGPPFRPEDISAIDVIKNYLSGGELLQARRLETVYFSPVFNRAVGVFISGLRSYETSFCFYTCCQGDAHFERDMKNFTDAVYDGLPEENPGALAWEWYRVTTPEGARFYPIEAHDNLQAWKERVTAVASERAMPVAYFDHGKFRLSDGRQWAFGDLLIDRLEGGKPIPRDW